MTTAELTQFVKDAPNGPGIYKFLGSSPAGEIYIGKATSIKKRLTSYLKTEDSRIRQMIDRADSVQFIQTDSDIEALILESQLIKQRRPMFNVMLRDDKQYFYVGFTREHFPRIFLTHQPNRETWNIKHEPGRKKIQDSRFMVQEYVGPFTNGATLKATLKFLRTVFPYCTCKQKHHNFCLNYHISKCLGVCCLRYPEAVPNCYSLLTTYKNNIKALREILSGRKALLVKQLKKQMESAGKAHKFDMAIELRDKLEKLERVFYNAQIIRNSEILKAHRSDLQALLKLKKPVIRIEGYDVSNIQGKHATGSMVTFVHGKPDKNYYRKFNVHPNNKKLPVSPLHDRAIDNRELGDTGMLAQIIERRFRHTEWPFPDLIVIDGGKGQVNTTVKTLAKMNIKIQIIGVSKDERHMGHRLIIPKRKTPLALSKLSPADKNLLLAINHESHRFAISHYRHLHRKNIKAAF